jgi:5-methylcytosine-specific restriction enzyme subunit McrC
MVAHVITLVENQSLLLKRTRLPESAAEVLWRTYRNQVEIETPSFKTEGCWRLRAQNWIGYLPVSDEIGVRIEPKLPIRTLFALWEYVYDWQGLRLDKELFGVGSVDGLVERLAVILAKWTSQRCRRGLYRGYVEQRGALPYVRGRMLIRLPTLQSNSLLTTCTYQEQTVDVEENQILAWTLHLLLRSGRCGARSRADVARAYRLLRGPVSLRPFTAHQCRNRVYTRLTADYRPLLALCAFFLEQIAPTQRAGTAQTPAFLVDMALLYERFVAAWLARHLSGSYRLQVQERVLLAAHANLHFELDLVIYDAASGVARCVIDTKYKLPIGAPAAEDVAQVLAYAQSKAAPEAILLYPAPLRHPIDHPIQGIRLRTLTFDLRAQVEEAGRELLQQLGMAAPAT